MEMTKETGLVKPMDLSKLDYQLNHVPGASEMRLNGNSVWISTLFCLTDKPQSITQLAEKVKLRMETLEDAFNQIKEVFFAPLISDYVPGSYTYPLMMLLVPEKENSGEIKSFDSVKNFQEPFNLKIDELNTTLGNVGLQLIETAKQVLGYRIAGVNATINTFKKSGPVVIPEELDQKAKDFIGRYNQLPDGVFFQQVTMITTTSKQDVTALLAAFNGKK